jgi:hypothetical protein
VQGKKKIWQLKPAVRFFKIKSTTKNNLWKGVRNEDVGNIACAFIILLVRIVIWSKIKPVYLNKKLYILIFTRISLCLRDRAMNIRIFFCERCG